MAVRIVTLGRIPADLESRLHAAAGADPFVLLPFADLAESAPASVADTVRAMDPDLVVLGEGAPCRCQDLAEPARNGRRVVPLVSLAPDAWADFDVAAEGREPEAVLRAALRMARLRQSARAAAGAAPSTAGMRRLSAEFTRALRYRHPLAVVVLALDHADAVRETYGPEVTEGFVTALAEALSGSLRAADFLFRSGEFELVVGLPETTAAGARIVAQRLRTRTRSLVYKGGDAEARPALPFKATASVGVADGPGRGVGSAADLLGRAMQAMDAARRSGGDRVAFAAVSMPPDR